MSPACSHGNAWVVVKTIISLFMAQMLLAQLYKKHFMKRSMLAGSPVTANLPQLGGITERCAGSETYDGVQGLMTFLNFILDASCHLSHH